VRSKLGTAEAKGTSIAKQLGHDVNNFKAGDYFIASILRKGNKKSKELHGERMDMSEEEQTKNWETFFSSLRETMEKFDITLDHLYNADQTGLFYNKLPNCVYIDKDQQDYHGIKQMKSKDQVMLMVASSASGKKAPLFMVGKSKSPECFKLCGGVPPIAYT
jgi:hypothetical protein